jgi:hypothetical protein
MDLPDSNSIAGLASLVTSLLMVPAIKSLNKIAGKHGEKLEEHDSRIGELELVKRKARKRRRW